MGNLAKNKDLFAQTKEIEQFNQNEAALKDNLRIGEHLYLMLKKYKTPLELEKMKKEYLDVMHRYYEEAKDIRGEKGTRVTRNELKKLNDSVFVLQNELKKASEKNKSTINLKQEKKGQLDISIDSKKGKKEVYEDRFLARSTNGKEVAAYMEYMYQNKEELDTFIRTLDTDEEFAANFIIYWTGEVKYRKYEGKWFDNMLGMSKHHALTSLRSDKKFKVAELFNSLCLKKQEEFRQLGQEIRYERGHMVRTEQKRMMRNLRDLGFGITKGGTEDGKEIINIDKNVANDFNNFLKSGNKINELTNAQIARIFSYVYVATYSDEFIIHGEIMDKKSIQHLFVRRISEDPEGLTHIAKNFGTGTDSIDKKLSVSGHKAQKVMIDLGLAGVETAMGNHLTIFLDKFAKGMDTTEKNNLKQEVIRKIEEKRKAGITQYSGLFQELGNIFEKHGIKSNKNFEMLFIDIVKLKKTELVFQLTGDCYVNHEKGDQDGADYQKSMLEFISAEGEPPTRENIKKKKEAEKKLLINQKKIEAKAMKDPKYKELLKKTKELRLNNKIIKASQSAVGSGILFKELANKDIRSNEELDKKIDATVKAEEKKKELEYYANDYLKIINGLGIGKFTSLDEIFNKHEKLMSAISVLQSKGNLNEIEEELLEKLLEFSKYRKEENKMYLRSVKEFSDEEIEKMDESAVEKEVSESIKIKSQEQVQEKNVNNREVSTRNIDNYFKANKVDVYKTEDDILIRKSDNGSYLINGEICSKEKEITNVIESIRFFREIGSEIFCRDMQSLMRSFKESALGMKSQISFESKDGLSKQEKTLILRGIISVLYPDEKDVVMMPMEYLIQKLRNTQNMKERTVGNLAEKAGITISRGIQEIDYEKLKSALK